MEPCDYALREERVSDLNDVLPMARFASTIMTIRRRRRRQRRRREEREDICKGERGYCSRLSSRGTMRGNGRREDRPPEGERTE